MSVFKQQNLAKKNKVIYDMNDIRNDISYHKAKGLIFECILISKDFIRKY